MIEFSFGGDNPEFREKPSEARVRLFRDLADQGIPDAAYKLYHCLINGWGTPADEVEAKRWLRFAAEQGQREAQFVLSLYGPQTSENLEWMLRAANQGLVAAQYGLGVTYYDNESPHRNVREAIRWFRAAAEQGEVGSQLMLAEIFEFGADDVPKDPMEARRWLVQAAGVDYGAAIKLLRLTTGEPIEAAKWAYVARDLAGEERSRVRGIVRKACRDLVCTADQLRAARRFATEWLNVNRRHDSPLPYVVFEDT